MTVASIEVLGTVRPDGMLELDQKVTLPPGRVKVWLEPIEPPVRLTESLVEFVDRARREMAAAGHRFRCREEIDAEIQKLRSEWEDRLEELDHLTRLKNGSRDP
jgi:hypothetical protein